METSKPWGDHRKTWTSVLPSCLGWPTEHGETRWIRYPSYLRPKESSETIRCTGSMGPRLSFVALATMKANAVPEWYWLRETRLPQQFRWYGIWMIALQELDTNIKICWRALPANFYQQSTPFFTHGAKAHLHVVSFRIGSTGAKSLTTIKRKEEKRKDNGSHRSTIDPICNTASVYLLEFKDRDSQHKNRPLLS